MRSMCAPMGFVGVEPAMSISATAVRRPPSEMSWAARTIPALMSAATARAVCGVVVRSVDGTFFVLAWGMGVFARFG